MAEGRHAEEGVLAMPYKVVEGPHDPKMLDALLNQMEQDGWEMVPVMYRTNPPLLIFRQVNAATSSAAALGAEAQIAAALLGTPEAPAAPVVEPVVEQSKPVESKPESKFGRRGRR